MPKEELVNPLKHKMPVSAGPKRRDGLATWSVAVHG